MLWLGELILMLVVVVLDICIVNWLLYCCGIQFDVIYVELFWCYEIVFVLFVVVGNFLFGYRLFCCQCVNIDSCFMYYVLLCDQCCQFVGFIFQYKIGIGNVVNQLLGSELVMQCLGVLIGGYFYLVEDIVIVVVIKFVVNLEGWGCENCLFNLFIVDIQFQFMCVLIQQCFVDQMIQYLLMQGFYIVFVCCQFGVLIVQLLLYVIMFVVEGVFELFMVDFLVIYFCGVVIVFVNQVIIYVG